MVTFTQPDAESYESDAAETWKPKAGSPQNILGTVLERKTVSREDGTDVELLKLETKDGQQWTVWVSPKMLRDCVRRDDPQPGDTWGIEYQGSKPVGPGRNMDLYGSFIKPSAKTAKTTKAQPDMSSGPKDAAAYVEDGDPF